MIAKITRGKNPGDIGAYLHGPGKANEHTYTAAGQRVSGGVVVGSNVGAEGQTDPRWWAGELRKAVNTRPEIKNPVWHASLRNTKGDRTLTNDQWADIGQSFAEDMGYAEHPWVMVRHGDDHVHIVVNRTGFNGQFSIIRECTPPLCAGNSLNSSSTQNRAKPKVRFHGEKWAAHSSNSAQSVNSD